MVLIDVQNDAGELKAIAQGFVTDHMVRIQQARGRATAASSPA